MVFSTITNSKTSKIDKNLFEKIEKKIIDLHQDSDKDSFEIIKKNLTNPPILNDEEFAFEVIYVILAGGFSQKTAKRIFGEICDYIKKRNEVSGKEIFQMFHNPNKTNAIAKVWNNRKFYREKFYSIKSDSEKLEFLGTLPHIGKITKNHIARNLGISIVKYDIWIQRLGISLFGTNETAEFPLDENVKKYCDKMFENLQKETNLPVGYLDAVLWKACQIGILYFDK